VTVIFLPSNITPSAFSFWRKETGDVVRRKRRWEEKGKRKRTRKKKKKVK
jgi:hypothetical protein